MTKHEIRTSDILPLNGTDIYLRELELKDVTDRYLSWMQDTVLNQYLESRFATHTFASLEEFVCKRLESETEWMFAICSTEGDEHIGNIKLGPVNTRHGHGEIGLIVGEASWHGKGVATEAIRLLTVFAFETLNLRKLTAGMYSANIGSRRAFEKNGFVLEGTLRKQVRVGDEFQDVYRMGLLKE